MPASGEVGFFFPGEGIHFSTPVLSAAAHVPLDKFSLLQQVLSISQKRKIKTNPKHEEPPQKLLSWVMGRRPASRLLLRRARGSGASKKASIYTILFYGIKPEWHLLADKVSLCHTVEGCAARSCLELHLKPGNQMICPDNFGGKPQTSYAAA